MLRLVNPDQDWNLPEIWVISEKGYELAPPFDIKLHDFAGDIILWIHFGLAGRVTLELDTGFSLLYYDTPEVCFSPPLDDQDGLSVAVRLQIHDIQITKDNKFVLKGWNHAQSQTFQMEATNYWVVVRSNARLLYVEHD